MSAKTKTQLDTDIDTYITTNGNNEITGAQLNTILKDNVDSWEDFIGSYTTAQIAALVGMTLRQRVFNTTDNDYEYYDGTRWVKEAHPKYKVYTALLTQTGTDAPVATVLENTLGGTVVWSYGTVGEYAATLAGAFVGNKTFIIIGSGTNNVNITNNSFTLIQSDDVITIYTGEVGVGQINGYLSNTAFEIRVYY